MEKKASSKELKESKKTEKIEKVATEKIKKTKRAMKGNADLENEKTKSKKTLDSKPKKKELIKDKTEKKRKKKIDTPKEEFDPGILIEEILEDDSLETKKIKAKKENKEKQVPIKKKKTVSENKKENSSQKIKNTNQTFEPTLKKKPTKKKKKLKKPVKIVLIIFLFLIILSSAFLILKIFKPESIPVINEPKIDYNDYFFDTIKTLDTKKIYELKDNQFTPIGTIQKDINLSLEKDDYLEDGYFKIKDSDYYLDYQDIEEGKIELSKKATYLNYIPFNESIQTTKETNFYQDEKLVFTLNEGMTFPIIIKEDDFYGVLYKEKLFYLKKDEGEVISSNNTTLKHTSAIATLTYHFVYDSDNPEEKRNCLNSNVTICLSDNQFRDHLTYIKDNGFYTATMKDLELFIDGKVQLPEKTVVITIDDGYYVSAAIKVLEELNLHATLFLIGVAGDPDNYKSDNLEIHSHSYAMHYGGACSGGQGSPFKCLDRELLLEDLRKSREQLNGSEVFCYPFFEYNDYAISVLKEAGFKMAFIGGRYKIKVGTNKYKLPRYGIINTTYVSDIKKIIG